MIIVQLFQLRPQIGNQILLAMNGQILIALLTQKTDEFPLQFRFRLVTVRACFYRLVFCDYRIFICRCDNIEIRHSSHPLLLLDFLEE